MALNFPNSPSLNDTHTHNGLTWVWNGSVWEMQGSGGASVTVSDNAPSSPTHGDMWWESDTGDLKIYYDESETGAGLWSILGICKRCRLNGWYLNQCSNKPSDRRPLVGL